MIRTIVFDMGGVLLSFDHAQLIRDAGVTDPADAALVDDEVLCSLEWVRLDRGSMDREEGLHAMCARLPERLRSAGEHLVTSWFRPLRPIPGMADLVRELKALGYPLYLLSNAGTNQKDYWPLIPGSECFDGTLISADVGLLKPEAEIYRLLYGTFSLRPEDCFFIDDSPGNIEGAFETGMPGFVFRGDVRKLRAALIARGVPLRG